MIAWPALVIRRRALTLIALVLATCFCPFSAECQETLPSPEGARQESNWTIVEAEDATKCLTEGKTAIQIYPRSVDRQSVALMEGSRLSVSTDARVVYLRLPTVFAAPDAH